MTVWLIVFLLSNGEQAEVSSLWQPGKYECERLRRTMEADATASGWVTRCIAWDIPGDFSLAPAPADAASGGDTQVLRRLQELKNKADALDTSLDQVGSTTKNTEITVRNLESYLKRLEASIHSLRATPCYR